MNLLLTKKRIFIFEDFVSKYFSFDFIRLFLKKKSRPIFKWWKMFFFFNQKTFKNISTKHSEICSQNIFGHFFFFKKQCFWNTQLQEIKTILYGINNFNWKIQFDHHIFDDFFWKTFWIRCFKNDVFENARFLWLKKKTAKISKYVLCGWNTRSSIYSERNWNVTEFWIEFHLVK